jgi:serine/threonine protein kinase
VGQRFLPERAAILFQEYLESPHTHIQRLDHSFVDLDSGDLCFLTAFLEGGELFARLSTLPEPLSEDTAGMLVRQMLVALDLLHSLGVVHRDLKPENWCLAGPDLLSPMVLIDFGEAVRVRTDRELVRGLCGSVNYSAPEVHQAFAAGSSGQPSSSSSPSPPSSSQVSHRSLPGASGRRATFGPLESSQSCFSQE